MNKLIILNHKMNLLYNEVNNYINITNEILKYNNCIILPSTLYIDKFINNSIHKIGIQNIDYQKQSNNTGSLSVEQIKSMNIKYTLVGHSEMNEPYNISNQKIKWLIDDNITPIVCLGEREKIESLDKLYEKISCKINDLFNNIDKTNEVIFAYEPYWAIGSGCVPTIENINKVIIHIKKTYYQKYKKYPKVVYGGSVSKSPLNELFSMKDLDGIIIGANSTDIEKLNRIIN